MKNYWLVILSIMLMVFIYPFLSRGRYRKNRIFKHTLIHTYKRKFFSFCLKLHRKPKGTSFLLVLKYFLKKENNKNFVFVSYLRFFEMSSERDCVELSRCMQVWDWMSTDDFLYFAGHYIQNDRAVVLPFLGLMQPQVGSKFTITNFVAGQF